jgi:hypothetical protein
MASDTRKLDESKLYKLRRVIPNAFSLYSSNRKSDNHPAIVEQRNAVPPGVSVASFPRI